MSESVGRVHHFPSDTSDFFQILLAVFPLGVEPTSRLRFEKLLDCLHVFDVLNQLGIPLFSHLEIQLS